jgi:hypothetical protein
MTLYDIQGEYLRLYDMVTEDDEALEDTLASLNLDLSDKSEGYVAVIKQLEMESDECDKVIAQFQEKKKARQNSIKRLKDALLSAMDIANLTELKAGSWTLKVAKNGGKAPVEIPDEAAVPESYMRIKYEVDKDLIRKDLEEGKDLGFATLGERGRHINIR